MSISQNILDSMLSGSMPAVVLNTAETMTSMICSTGRNYVTATQLMQVCK